MTSATRLRTQKYTVSFKKTNVTSKSRKHNHRNKIRDHRKIPPSKQRKFRPKHFSLRRTVSEKIARSASCESPCTCIRILTNIPTSPKDFHERARGFAINRKLRRLFSQVEVGGRKNYFRFDEKQAERRERRRDRGCWQTDESRTVYLCYLSTVKPSRTNRIAAASAFSGAACCSY